MFILNYIKNKHNFIWSLQFLINIKNGVLKTISRIEIVLFSSINPAPPPHVLSPNLLF